MEELKRPVLYLSYTDEFGLNTNVNMDLYFSDTETPLTTLFAAFSRFLIMTGYHPDSVKEYFEEF
jgi:hypothetical protein